jgi:hypothetical protein
MRNKILNNIKDGLAANMGEDGLYADLKIEDIQNRFPQTITVNRFIGVAIERAGTEDKEIGNYCPVRKNYNCSVVVVNKSADYDSGQTDLDTLVNRIIKYFKQDTGNLNGLSLTKDSIVETVYGYSVEDFDYVSGEFKVGNLGHFCIINLLIKTEIII